MRKISITFLFLLLVIRPFIYTGFTAPKSSSSLYYQATSVFRAHGEQPDSETEYSQVVSLNFTASPQKFPRVPTTRNFRFYCSSTRLLCASTKTIMTVEVFNNHNRYHTYPSHNFW